MPLTRPLVRTLGTSLNNAVVPSDAPILPFQAYVDYVIPIVAGLSGGTSITAANAGITFFDPAGLDLVSYIWGGTVDFSGNLFGTASVDASLAHAAANNSFLTLDLSGADMGVPTPAQPRINGEALFQCASYPADQDVLNIIGLVAYTVGVIFDAAVDFGDSASSTVGIQDTPTLEQINTYLATYGGLVDGVILVTDDAELPLLDTSTPGLLASPFTAGQPFIENADIVTCVNNVATITVMEYVDRISGEKEPVTYALSI